MARRLTSNFSEARPRDALSPARDLELQPDHVQRSASTRWWLLGVAVAGAGGLAAAAPPHGAIVALVVVVSTGACGALAVAEQRDPRLGVRPVVAAIAIVFALAVAAPPRASNDLWSYAAYGRMVSVHGASPYDKTPADFRSDPLFDHISPVWWHRGSVYGPVFVGFAAAGTFLARDSVDATRLFFQLSAAAAVAMVLFVVWRRTRSPAALIWLGLHPLFGATIVNGGHIDALIGLGVLVAALLAAKRRGVAAGAVIGLVALVKLPALLALLGIMAWGWKRRDLRVPLVVTATAGAMVVLSYLPFLPGALRVLRGANHMVTPGSLWNAPAQWLVGHDAGRDPAGHILSNTSLSLIYSASFVLVAIVAVAVAWRAARRRSRPDQAVGAATASYTVAAEWTLPWYGAWTLPVLADRRPSPLAWVVWIQTALLLAAWKLPLPPTSNLLDDSLIVVLVYAAPIVLAVAFVATASSFRANRSPAAPSVVTSAY